MDINTRPFRVAAVDALATDTLKAIYTTSEGDTIGEGSFVQFRAFLLEGLNVSAKIGQLRFEEAVEDLLNDYRVNGRRALEHVNRRVKKALAPWFGGRRMATITTADIRAYIAQRLTDGAANATINRELAALKRAFSLAIQATKLLHKPHIPMLAEHNIRRGFFEREQFDSVSRHLPEPLCAVATFAYLTGWRTPSEILTMQWHQVDLKAGTVRLEPGTTKNGDGRVFMFAAVYELQKVLTDQNQLRQDLADKGIICPWVFHRDGQPIKSYRRAC